MCHFLSGEENMLGESSYKYLTVDEMKSLGDDSMPIDVTHDEKHLKADSNYQQVRFLFFFKSITMHDRIVLCWALVGLEACKGKTLSSPMSYFRVASRKRAPGY